MYSYICTLHITKYPGIYCTLVNYSLLPSTKYSTPYQEWIRFLCMIRSLLLQWLYLRDEVIYQILICYLLIWRKLIKDKVHWSNFRSFNLKRTLLFVDMHLIFSTIKVKENYLSLTKLLQNLHVSKVFTLLG